MSEEIVLLEDELAFAHSKNLIAKQHGIPTIGTRTRSEYGIEWLVNEHVYAPDLISCTRDGGNLIENDPRDLLPVITLQNSSPKLKEFAVQIDRCTSRPLMMLDTLPDLRPRQAHPDGHRVCTLYHPDCITFFFDAARAHETIIAHELAHVWIELVDEREDLRSLRDTSDGARVYQFDHLQSLVLDQRVNEILRERDFDLSIVEQHQRKTVLDMARAVGLGRRPDTPREAVTVAMLLASVLLEQERGLHEKVVLSRALCYDGTIESGLRLLHSFLPDVYALAQGFVESIHRHGYGDQQSVCRAIDDCVSAAFDFTGDPIREDELEINEKNEPYKIDKWPQMFSGWPIKAKVEAGILMAKLGIGCEVEYNLSYSPGGSALISFRTASGALTAPCLMPSAPSPLSFWMDPWHQPAHQHSRPSPLHSPQLQPQRTRPAAPGFPPSPHPRVPTPHALQPHMGAPQVPVPRMPQVPRVPQVPTPESFLPPQVQEMLKLNRRGRSYSAQRF